MPRAARSPLASSSLAALLLLAGCERASAPGTSGAVIGAAPPPPQVEPLAAEQVTAPANPSAAPWSDAWMSAEAERYLGSASFRRGALLASLTNHANSYSRQRIASYGHGTRGWDTLPVWNPRSLPVDADAARALREGRAPEVPGNTPPLWDGQRPADRAGWIALGRRVFFGYPLRAEPFMAHALARDPDGAARAGVRAARDGVYAGLRVFADTDGVARVGITCALCHTRVEPDGALTVGAARREFDYGRLRLAYHRDTGATVDEDLARRMATWGPGRADVTEDEAEDPVAIPDLWGLAAQSALTQAGTIRHIGPAALAIRQETQLLHSNHQRIRPPRELAWALAVYLYSLEPPPSPEGDRAAPATIARGAALFDEHCASCHANAARGGDPLPAARVGTDLALATGSARGTGAYRPSALVRVRDGAPYLHHGAVPSLEDLLSRERLAREYARSPLGPGPVPGHAYGVDLARAERAALIAFLRTL